MKDRDREIVELHVEHGMKLKEIAPLYGITYQRVQQILRRNGIEGYFLSNRRFHNWFHAVGVAARLAYRATEPWHGTYRGFQYYRCRCEKCVQAYRNRCRELQVQRSTREPPKHGLSGYVNYSCRCPICRAAQSEKNRERRNRQRQTPSNHRTFDRKDLQ
jgi:hypothetical protein